MKAPRPDVKFDSGLKSEFTVSFTGHLWIRDLNTGHLVLLTSMEQEVLRKALDEAERQSDQWKRDNGY